MRVVSLVPSVTETLLAWGVVPVAVTRFCEQPGLPTVGGTKDPDVAAIVGLAPDLVVMDDEENRREDADALVQHGLRLHVTHVRSLADVAPTLVALAAALSLPGHHGRGAVAHRIVDASVGDVPEQEQRRVVVPIWRRPLMVLGGDTYGSSLLAELGLRNVFADHRIRYPVTTLEEVAARRPRLVLLPTEPYPFKDRHATELAGTLGIPARLVDGRDLFWWGVRTTGAVARLRQALSS